MKTVAQDEKSALQLFLSSLLPGEIGACFSTRFQFSNVYLLSKSNVRTPCLVNHRVYTFACLHQDEGFFCGSSSSSRPWGMVGAHGRPSKGVSVQFRNFDIVFFFSSSISSLNSIVAVGCNTYPDPPRRPSSSARAFPLAWFARALLNS